jgi:hypothetical protein
MQELAERLAGNLDQNFAQDRGAATINGINSYDEAGLQSLFESTDPNSISFDWTQGVGNTENFDNPLTRMLREQLSLIRAANSGDPRAQAELATRKQQYTAEQDRVGASRELPGKYNAAFGVNGVRPDANWQEIIDLANRANAKTRFTPTSAVNQNWNYYADEARSEMAKRGGLSQFAPGVWDQSSGVGAG